MKKIMVMIMVFAIIGACSLNVFAGSKVDGDKEAVAYIGSITIDGTIESTWDSAPAITVDTLKENASSYFGDSSKVYGTDYAKLTIKTLWNPDAKEIYILYIVEDKEISLAGGNDWEKDSIELFIDEDNVREGALDGNSHQIRVLAEASTTGDGTLYDAVTTLTTTGYVVEFVYHFQEDVPSNGWVGFDVQVNDDAEGNGTRHACVGWSDPVDKASSDNTYWGQVYLSDVFVADAQTYNYEYVDQADLDVELARLAAIVVEEVAAPATSTPEAPAASVAPAAPQTSDTAFIIFTSIAVMAMAAFMIVKRIKN